jgi:hypothetical protein
MQHLQWIIVVVVVLVLVVVVVVVAFNNTVSTGCCLSYIPMNGIAKCLTGQAFEGHHFLFQSYIAFVRVTEENPGTV